MSIKKSFPPTLATLLWSSLILVSDARAEKSADTTSAQFQTFPSYKEIGYDQPYRPKFHFTSLKNWINDPNGLLFELKIGSTNFFYFIEHKQLGETPFLQNVKDKCIVHDKEDGKIDFRFYIDRATYEAIVENGSVYKIGSRGISSGAVGKISIGLKDAEGTADLKVSKLKSIWPENVDTLMYSNKK